MKLAKLRKIDIAALIIFLIFCWFIFRISQGGFYCLAGNEINSCVRPLKEHIRAHNGNLPDNKKEFEVIVPQNLTSKYDLNYNFNIEQVDFSSGSLRNKVTGKEILILRGPVFWLIKKEHKKLYEDASVELFIEMLRSRREHCAHDKVD